jgi:hypothetical protein
MQRVDSHSSGSGTPHHPGLLFPDRPYCRAKVSAEVSLG